MAKKRPVKNRLTELRKKGVVLSQQHIGLLLGYDHGTISRHESGKLRLSDENLKAYAEIYGVSTHEIFFSGDSVSDGKAEADERDAKKSK